ncbi:MAG: DNA repair protein RecN [Oscillospiraceae bacterium]|jgi:DNA repair protein RecN (Recombination protein N)
MLTRLYIQNVAVIRKAEIRLGTGLNVFTGETGAGKTILISAIDAVLGERTARDMIRTGEEKAMVSAFFENISPRALETLRELGYDEDEGGVLITRELTSAGKSTCKINGMPATASILKQISSLLIHIHGQRDGTQLLSPERHMEMIDSYGRLEPLLEEYRAAYRRLRELEAEIQRLAMDDQQKAQRIDMLTFQIQEIEGAELDDPDEEEELLARKKLISSSEKVLEALSAAYSALKGDEEREGIDVLFDQLTAGVDIAGEYLPSLAPMAARLEEMGYELEEFATELRDTLDSFEFDPQELSDIEYRLDQLYKLKRKYGGDIPAILEFCQKAREELEQITTGEERLAQLHIQREEALEQARKLAAELTSRREQAAAEFIQQVEEELAFLDMGGVRLSAQREEKPLAPDGADSITLYVVTNVGEEAKPLHKIASGGEISRMMLSMKNVLADRDDIDTLIFDEVDIGVSGRAAQKIGRKLAQVSKGRQVICVTHLAQVAAFADNHLLIQKEVEDGRTYTRVRELNHQERVEELSRITSGDNITATALENARELLEHAQKTKAEEVQIH